MSITLEFGGLVFEFTSDEQIDVNKALLPFVSGKNTVDVTVNIRTDSSTAVLPEGDFIGKDRFNKYYKNNGVCYSAVRGFADGYRAVTQYDRNYRKMECIVNREMMATEHISLGNALSFIPMREIFMHYGILYCHASQIVYNNKGIVFAAPSGTGKTTQAKLWQSFLGARIICNDRTLIRKTDSGWKSYGFLLDGSEPICSNSENSLGAVVLLAQGKTCEIRRLNSAKAAALFLEQLIIDAWSNDARTASLEKLLNLSIDIPIYQYYCTPDETAVYVLNEQLVKDGVL